MSNHRSYLGLLAAALVGNLVATGCKEDAVRVVYPEDLEQVRGVTGPAASPYDPESASTDATKETDKENEFTIVKVYYGTDRAVGPPEGRERFSIRWVQLAWALAVVVVAVGVMLARRMRSSGRMARRMRAFALGTLSLAVLAALFVTFAWWQVNRGDSPSNDIYGNERGTLQRGFCEVSIPKSHVIGRLESPSVLRFEFRENPTRDVVLESVSPEPADEFFADLGRCVGESRSQSAFVFVHGFNVRFEKAARRTAQMAYDLKFDGAPIFFSWPSQGDLLRYAVDETNAAWAMPHLKEFLVEVAARSGARSVHLIAHSMGNRPLTTALSELARTPAVELPLFKEVVLTAPDVDADVFRDQLAPLITKTAQRVTLYASSNDEALAFSKTIHGYARAGDTTDRPLVVLPGVDTIDVSKLDTSLLGHSYYGTNGTVLADLFQLLHGAKPPDERRWLRREPFGDLEYWIFLRERISDPKPDS